MYFAVSVIVVSSSEPGERRSVSPTCSTRAGIAANRAVTVRWPWRSGGTPERTCYLTAAGEPVRSRDHATSSHADFRREACFPRAIRGVRVGRGGEPVACRRDTLATRAEVRRATQRKNRPFSRPFCRFSRARASGNLWHLPGGTIAEVRRLGKLRASFPEGFARFRQPNLCDGSSWLSASRGNCGFRVFALSSFRDCIPGRITRTRRSEIAKTSAAALRRSDRVF